MIKNLLLSCIFVFVLFDPISSFGGNILQNNPYESLAPKFLPSNPYVNTAVTTGIIVGAVAVSYFWTHSNLFGTDASSDKGLDIDADREFREQILQKVTKEDGPPKKRDELFKGLKDNEEERLKKMSEKYWRERHGYGLSKDLDKDRKNLENKNPRAAENYAYKINSEEGSFSLAKDENSDIYDDGYEGSRRNKKEWFSGGIVRASGENSGTTETSGTQESGSDDSNENSRSIERVYSLEKLAELKNSGEIIQELFLSLTYIDDNKMDEAIDMVAEMLREDRGLRKLHICGDDIGTVTLGERGIIALGEALEENDSLEKFVVKGVLLDNEDTEAIAKALEKNRSLTVLKLKKNDIGTIGGKALAKSLEKNDTLEILDLQDNNIGDDGAHAFGSALKKNHHLIVLDINNNSIGDVGTYWVAKGLKTNNTLETLNISLNGVGSLGGVKLAKMLQKNISLKRLFILGNEIGPEAAIKIANSLKENNSLEVLEDISIGNNRKVAVAFAEMLEVNTSLKLLYFSDFFGDGADKLGDALNKNSTLKELNVKYAKKEMVFKILEKLKGNRSLQRFDFSMGGFLGRKTLDWMGINVDELVIKLEELLKENHFLDCIATRHGSLYSPATKEIMEMVRVGDQANNLLKLLYINYFLNSCFPDAGVDERKEVKEILMAEEDLDGIISMIAKYREKDGLFSAFKLILIATQIERYDIRDDANCTKLREMIMEAKVHVREAGKPYYPVFIYHLYQKMYYTFQSAAQNLSNIPDKKSLADELRKFSIVLLACSFGYSYGVIKDREVEFKENEIIFIRSLVEHLSESNGTGGVSYQLENLDDVEEKKKLMEGFFAVVSKVERNGTVIFEGESGRALFLRIIMHLFGNEAAKTIGKFEKKLRMGDGTYDGEQKMKIALHFFPIKIQSDFREISEMKDFLVGIKDSDDVPENVQEAASELLYLIDKIQKQLEHLEQIPHRLERETEVEKEEEEDEEEAVGCFGDKCNIM